MKQFTLVIRFIFVIVTLLISSVAFSQWIQTEGGVLDDYANCIAATSDNGVIVVGKSNNSSPPENRVIVVKYDESGNKEWLKTHPGSGGQSVVQTQDGGYAILTRSEGSGDVGVLKIDMNGEFEWLRDIDFEGSNYGKDIVQNSDGSYLILSTATTSTQDCFVTKLSGPSGTIDTVYNKQDVHPLTKMRLIQLSTGGYAISGTLRIGSFPSGSFISLLDDDYNVVRTEEIFNGHLLESRLLDIKQTNDGGFIFVGRDISNSNLITKVNSDLEVQWMQSYRTELFSEFSTVLNYDNDSYIVGGVISDQILVEGDNALWMRIDGNGEIIWSRTYGNQNARDRISWGTKTLNGDFAFTGFSSSSGAGGLDMFTLLVGSDGLEYNSNGCDPIHIQGIRSFGIDRDCSNPYFIHEVKAKSQCLSDPSLDYLLEIDYNNDGSIDFVDSISFLYQNFWPPGRHKLTWRVTDQCCSEEEVLIFVDFEDDYQSPTAMCKLSYTHEVFLDSTTILYAADIDDGSVDECNMIDLQIAIIHPSEINNDPSTFNFDYFHEFDLIDLGEYYCVLQVTDSLTPPEYCFSELTVAASNLISGEIKQDNNVNCNLEDTEPDLKNWIIIAEGNNGSLYGMTNADGQYQIKCDTGTYIVNAYPPTDFWEPCIVNESVEFTTYGLSETVNFSAEKLISCPLMTVNIGSGFYRRCDPVGLYIEYCNIGSEDAEDAYIEVELDPLFTIDSISNGYSFSQNDSLVLVLLGDVPMGFCDEFIIFGMIDCDAEIGSTLCSKAHIYPDSICGEDDALWDHSSIKLNATCDGDSVRFEITNIGSGDMASPSEYAIFRDAELIQGPEIFQLDVEEKLLVPYDAEGYTYRMEASQSVGHPGNSHPSISVERCDIFGDGNVSLGFVNQFGQDDYDYFISIDCGVVRGSFDPNDKLASPAGYGPEHLIKEGEDLTYKIRFQNTGNDTAFKVVVVDTLSPLLDIATIRPGVSSHDYTFDILGDRVLRFVFDNILLPDSIVNEAASHGFVEFNILQAATNQIGDRIENSAAIYFDFNDPIITNQTYHVIGRDFFNTSTNNLSSQKFEIFIQPNPAKNSLLLNIENDNNAPVNLELIDVLGKKHFFDSFNSESYLLNRGGWKAGVYFLMLTQKGRLIGTKKVIFN